MGCAASIADEPMYNAQVMSGGRALSLKGEDFFALREAVIGGETVHLCLVADGHGGKEAARTSAACVLDRIVAGAYNGSGKALTASAVAVFKDIHEEVKAIPQHNSGCTLTVCALNLARRELSIWNVGDSLAVLVHTLGFQHLGESHRLADSPKEQARVLELGAKLGHSKASGSDEPAGCLRAYPGGLAVTRCIGDADCPYVSPEPACATHRVPPDGGALLVCSDGVWDSLTSRAASQVLLDGKYASPEGAVEQIIKRSIASGLKDDTTAVVILFGPAPIDEEPPAELGANSDESLASGGGSSMPRRKRAGSFSMASISAGANMLISHTEEGNRRPNSVAGRRPTSAARRPTTSESFLRRMNTEDLNELAPQGKHTDHPDNVLDPSTPDPKTSEKDDSVKGGTVRLHAYIGIQPLHTTHGSGRASLSPIAK